MSDRTLANDVWESLFRAQHELFASMSSDFDGAAITQAEYDVLLGVTRAPNASARLRDITAGLLVSQPSVSRLIDRMVTRGLVTKTVDPHDGRGAIITAADAGIRAFRTVATRHSRTITRHMAPLDENEQRTLLALTQKLRGL